MTQITAPLTLRQLRRIANERAIEVWSLMNKDELIAALTVAERNRMVTRFAAAYECLNLGAVVQIAERN